MEENKTKEFINVFSNTYELIRQAAHILDHESMTKVCQHDEDFQNRVLDLIVGICRTRAYTEGIKNMKHPRILSIVLYVDVLKII